MDPITMAFVAAITAGVAAGATKVGEQVIVDAYNSLKCLLVRKFGGDSKVVQAVDDLEAEPESEGQKLVVGERVKKAQADQDADLLAAAQALLAKLKEQPGGTQLIQNVQGNYIAVAAGGSTASVTISGIKPDSEPK
jgi:hypothetical protein